jgi:hypothetical protein
MLGGGKVTSVNIYKARTRRRWGSNLGLACSQDRGPLCTFFFQGVGLGRVGVYRRELRLNPESGIMVSRETGGGKMEGPPTCLCLGRQMVVL